MPRARGWTSCLPSASTASWRRAISAPAGSISRSIEALLEALSPQLDGDTVVLVKGSRFMRMERVADAIAADEKPGNGVN